MPELAKLGRYQLRSVLGKGAMGVVYEGFDPSLNRRVAIKTILKSVVIDQETATAFSARFLREAKAAARLSHPGIVQVYDFSEENEVAYLVMEFIEGRELRNYFEAHEWFDGAEAVRIMSELLDALEFAHEAGVIHRDVKPANVMLDAQRHVKLTDFGVARIQDGIDHSKGGTMVGTPAFMSPEQISGKKVDRRSDLFSAGVILYQLLTGERPFKGEGAWTVAKQILQEEPPRPSTITSKIAPAFDQIVNKALAKNPEHRFASAKEFTEAVQGALPDGSSAAFARQKFSASARAQASDAEVEFWRSIQNSNDSAEFEVYLKEFPDGIYAELARIKIAKLVRISRGANDETTAAPLYARDTSELATLTDATARLAAELAKREADYRKREAEAESRRHDEENARVEAEAKREAEANARALAEEKARLDAIERARQEARAEFAKRQAEYQKRDAEARAQAEAEEKARLDAIERAKQEVKAEIARREAEYRKREAEALARAEAEAEARRDLETRTREEAEARAKAESDARARREAEEIIRGEAEARARAEARERARRRAEELAERQADIQRREAELNRRAAQASPNRARFSAVAVVFVAIAFAAVGAWYWNKTSDEARVAALTASFEAATRATQELNLARQLQEELLKRVEVARLAEDDARVKGDQAKLKELQELTKKAEAEAQKQNDLVKQRETEAKKADDAAKLAAAKKQTDTAKAAERAAQEKAAQENAAQEIAALDRAVAERAVAEQAVAAKSAAEKTAAQRATADRAAAERASVAKSAAEMPEAESSSSLPALWVAAATKLDGKWTGTALVSAGLNCVKGFYTITIKKGTVDGTVNWQGFSAGASKVTGFVEGDNIASIALLPESFTARSSQFALKLQNDRLVGRDAGPCSYDVSLSRG